MELPPILIFFCIGLGLGMGLGYFLGWKYWREIVSVRILEVRHAACSLPEDNEIARSAVHSACDYILVGHNDCDCEEDLEEDDL